MAFFSPEEQVIIDELGKVLPKSPFPGLHKQELLDEMGWKGYPLSKREEEWNRIYRVILKSRRMTEARQPDRPMIVNTGTSASEQLAELLAAQCRCHCRCERNFYVLLDLEYF